MESQVVREFNGEMTSLLEIKPPISKAKIVDITKSAMKAIKYYKHVVFIVEKFLQKCKPEYKIPGLYVIDSIVRQSQHQHKDRDVFGPRFAQNIKTTLELLMNCSSSDKLRIVRVLNLWKSAKVFEESLVDDLLSYCSESGLETDVQSVEMKVKGTKANMEIYSTPNPRKRRKNGDEEDSPLPSIPKPPISPLPVESTEPSETVPENGISERELLDLIRSVNLDLGGSFSSDLRLLRNAHQLVNEKLVKQRELDTNSHGSIQKLLTHEFDYSDEDSGDEAPPKPPVREAEPLSREEVIRIAGRILDHEEIKSKVKEMAYSYLSSNSMPPAPVPMSETFAAPPAPVNAFNSSIPPPNMPSYHVQTGSLADFNVPPHTEIQGSSAFSVPPPDIVAFSQYDNREIHSKRPRSRCPRENDFGNHDHVDRDVERERRKLCLPYRNKPGHMLIGSCTIWLGKLPVNTGENDIRSALSEMGDPLRVNVLPMRACAYVTMRDRKSAAKIVDRLKNSLQISRKFVKLDWAPGQMVKDRFKNYWNGEYGVTEIPYAEIPANIDSLLDNIYVDVPSLPDHLKGRFSESGEKAAPEPVPALIPPPVDLTPAPAVRLPPSLIPQLPPGVPQLPPGFPPAQFPYGLPPTAQALQFLPPGFPLTTLLAQQTQESLQNSAVAAAAVAGLPTSVPPPSIPRPPMMQENGNFRGPPPFEPRGNRGMTSPRGGFRHQFYGNNRGRGGHFNHNHRHPPPPHRFGPSGGISQDMTRPPPHMVPPRFSPPLREMQPSKESPSGGERPRRSRLFQSEQPRESTDLSLSQPVTGQAITPPS
ncbi:hypothetical protein L596_007336 [Steinernema carpocapsae]|uniref:CID domain-containing protein n=1 Tax=Steinernema carpocapsae TaxID=34508 RepID=A0A4U5P935_STECR|nr:hypothetical protein L596_007336 [Steinernema carpocapsae]